MTGAGGLALPRFTTFSSITQLLRSRLGARCAVRPPPFGPESDPLVIRRSFPSVRLALRRIVPDIDLAHQPLRLPPDEVDRQQPVAEFGRLDLDAVRQHERALELTGGDAAVEVLAGLVLPLLAADRELLVFQRDLEMLAGEAGNRERDPQDLRLGALALLGDTLDVVGWITVTGPLAGAIGQPFDFVEPQEQRVRQQGHACHSSKVLFKRPSPSGAEPCGLRVPQP